MTINMHQGNESFTVHIEGSNASFEGDVESREEAFEASMTENDMQLEVSMEENEQTFDADMGEVQIVPGGSSEPGKDGFSPIVDLTETDEGVQITVVDAEGEETAFVRNGKDGYTPVKGKDYQDGKDGVSPVVELTETAEGVEIAITDADGTETALVRHGKDGRDGKDGLPGERGETGPAGPQGERGLQGIQGVPGERGPQGIQGPAGEIGHQGIQGPAGKDGQPGERGPAGDPGQPGADGISPVVTVQDIAGGHRVTITDKDGAKTFDVMDGKDGTGGGGAQVQADWKVNDPESPAYVQNRTHYEILAFEPILWDGNMEGRFALDLSMLGYPDGQYFVKASDVVPSIEDVTNGKILLSVGAENTITASSIDESMFPGAYVVDMLVVVVHDQSALNAALGLPDGYVTDGTYFLWNNGLYVSKLTTGKTTIKQIDKKFLPEIEAPEVVIPEGVQSDWGQNDETKADFVKNRTHWVERAFEPIEWDSSTENRDFVDASDLGLGVLYKISDYPLSVEEYNSKLIVVIDSDDGDSITLSLENVEEIIPGVATICKQRYWGSTVCVLASAYQAGNYMGISIPSIGTYCYNVFAKPGITTKIEPETVYHKLDLMYMPDELISTTNILNMDDTGYVTLISFEDTKPVFRISPSMEIVKESIEWEVVDFLADEKLLLLEAEKNNLAIVNNIIMTGKPVRYELKTGNVHARNSLSYTVYLSTEAGDNVDSCVVMTRTSRNGKIYYYTLDRDGIRTNDDEWFALAQKYRQVWLHMRKV